MSTMKTAILMAGMTALFMAIGAVLGGSGGMVIAFLIAAGMNLFSFWGSDKMVLRMHGARAVSEQSAPDLWRMTKRLADNAGLPMPALYVIDNPQPNAFATGRNPQNAAVAVNTGLVDLLTREEVEGVVAHELAHIKNRDTLLMTVTATLAGAISMVANFGMFMGGNRDNNSPFGAIGTILIMILAPIAAMIVQMMISRTREYAADRTGAEISGNPRALASALAKIAGGVHRIENLTAERNPATAHMFIMNPLSGARMDNLFSTHPNPQNRIDALEQQAQTMGRTAGARPASARPFDDFADGGGFANPPTRSAGTSAINLGRRDPAPKKGPWG